MHAGLFVEAKPEVKKPVARPSCRWDNNIKMDLKNIVWLD